MFLTAAHMPSIWLKIPKSFIVTDFANEQLEVPNILYMAKIYCDL